MPHDQVYGLGIEDMLHREPVDREDRRGDRLGARRDTLDEILADVIAYERENVAARTP